MPRLYFCAADVGLEVDLNSDDLQTAERVAITIPAQDITALHEPQVVTIDGYSFLGHLANLRTIQGDERHVLVDLRVAELPKPPTKKSARSHHAEPRPIEPNQQDEDQQPHDSD